MTNKAFFVSIFLLTFLFTSFGQPSRWQQRVEYKMNVNFNVKTNRFKGTQRLTYFNNSPDTLKRVFYHLYFNAFQKGSMMEIRSRNLPDRERNIASSIEQFTDDQIGFLKVKSLTQDGRPVDFEEAGTILEVTLPKPVLPHTSVMFDMKFEGQIPLLIRRAGRDNSEGIDYSFAQWYPKMCEYDYQGWHADPYIAREFYGVWGDYDVTITLDKKYVVAATGFLQNPEEIGYGYGTIINQKKWDRAKKLSWHFRAENVHDFVWAADRDYEHVIFDRKDGVRLHFFFQHKDGYEDAWSQLPPIMDKAMDFINKTYGHYPFKTYSFIQAGDGGMEYPLATFIAGGRSLYGLVSVCTHELIHSWFQMVLANNESLYPWMDEGFTSYATSETMNYLKKTNVLNNRPTDNPHRSATDRYLSYVGIGLEEPLSTHADHYNTNAAYWLGAYAKGEAFLQQLQYIIGKDAFDRGMLRYFNTWKFKHPNANDFIRVMEKESGLELDWYKEYFINTTYYVDYGIRSVAQTPKGIKISLERIGILPMPVDVVVTYSSGKKTLYNIPLRLMRGSKMREFSDMTYQVLPDWYWVQPGYSFVVKGNLSDIAKIEIDPSERMADKDKSNNTYVPATGD